MAMYHWANLVTDTGRVRVDILVCRGVPPCWCLTRTGGDVSLPPLKTVRFLLPKLPHQAKKITLHLDLEMTSPSNHQTHEEEVEEEDPRDHHQEPVHYQAEMVENLFHLTCHLVQYLSTQIIRPTCSLSLGHGLLLLYNLTPTNKNTF